MGIDGALAIESSLNVIFLSKLATETEVGQLLFPLQSERDFSFQAGNGNRSWPVQCGDTVDGAACARLPEHCAKYISRDVQESRTRASSLEAHRGTSQRRAFDAGSARSCRDCFPWSMGAFDSLQKSGVPTGVPS